MIEDGITPKDYIILATGSLAYNIYPNSLIFKATINNLQCISPPKVIALNLKKED